MCNLIALWMAYIESRFPNVPYWINSTEGDFRLQVQQVIFNIPPPELCLSLSFLKDAVLSLLPTGCFSREKRKLDSWQSKKFPNHRVSATCMITEAKISNFYPATGELLFWSTWKADRNENPPWPGQSSQLFLVPLCDFSCLQYLHPPVFFSSFLFWLIYTVPWCLKIQPNNWF